MVVLGHLGNKTLNDYSFDVRDLNKTYDIVFKFHVNY